VTTALASPRATAIDDLVLVRMALPSKKPVSPSAVRKDVAKLLDHELSTAEFDAMRDKLAADGLLTKGKRNTFALTEAGREQALRCLGVTELPPRANWSTAIATYLFPKAAGLSADAAAELNSGDKLAAFMLKRKYRLAHGAGSTVSQVLETVVCNRLGFPDETRLEGLLCAVLSKLMESQRLTKKQIAKQLPLFETGVASASADAARCKIVRDWLSSGSQASSSQRSADVEPLDTIESGAPSEPSPSPRATDVEPFDRTVDVGESVSSSHPRAHEVEPFDLAAFAATVRALAAKSPPEDRFHDNKVFIAALWRATQREPSFPRLSLAEFKERLLEVNSHSLLHLSRADLVSAMDPQSVADSETEYLNATFHFVLLEEDNP